MKPVQPQLFDYGIHNEGSDIRAHVGMKVYRVYAFPTISGKRAVAKLIDLKKCPAIARQPGVSFATAKGYPIPWNEIEHIKRIIYPREWVANYDQTLSTTEKGHLAVCVVERLLRDGRFPLWIEGLECSDKELNISGTDITVKGKWKIQVKCDARCGEIELGGTGNIFLQTKELNPLSMQ